MSFGARITAAILTGLLLIGQSSCATKRAADVPLLDGRHVKAWPRDDALGVPAISNQAAVADGWVYVVSDVGLDLMFKVKVERR